MSLLIAVLSLIMGLIGVFRPSFFYKSELCTPQEIERNKRVGKISGVVLIALGLGLLALNLFVK
jgi:hypothetical protein